MSIRSDGGVPSSRDAVRAWNLIWLNCTQKGLLPTRGITGEQQVLNFIDELSRKAERYDAEQTRLTLKTNFSETHSKTSVDVGRNPAKLKEVDAPRVDEDDHGNGD